MIILTRYIIRQHIGPFLFGLSIIIFIFLTNFILQNLYRFIGKGLSLWTIIEVISLNMAWIVALAIPMAVLISTVMTFGRLSEDNEINALQAGGVSPLQIMRSMIIMSGIIAVGLTYFNNDILPEANHRARLLMSDIYQTKPALSFQEGVFSTQIPDMRVMIQKIDPNSPQIFNIIILDNSEYPLRRSIVAEKGSFIYAAGADRLVLTLYNGEIHEVNPEHWNEYQRLQFSKHIITIPMEESGFHRTQTGYRGDREKSAQEMREEMALVKEEIKGYQASSAQILEQLHFSPDTPISSVLDSLSRMLQSKPLSFNTTQFPEMHLQRLQEYIGQLQNFSSMITNRLDYLRSLLVEIHKKYAIPVACIVLVLIGAPLGMMTRKGGIAYGGGISLGFFILYWAFLIGGEELADRGFVDPALAMWSANILIGVVGIWLTYRVTRGTYFINLHGFYQRIRSKNS